MGGGGAAPVAGSLSLLREGLALPDLARGAAAGPVVARGVRAGWVVGRTRVLLVLADP